MELVREAVEVPGPATEKLGQAAREASAYVVIGVNERSRRSMGELFNTNLIFAPGTPLAAICEVTTTPTGFEFTGPQSWRLIEELRGRVNSASPEELRALVESLLASLPAK